MGTPMYPEISGTADAGLPRKRDARELRDA
jgi:hypothetical protein